MPKVTLTFLSLLFQGKPPDAQILIWRTPSKDSHWFADVESAAEFAAASTTSDVYVGVGLSSKDCGLYGRCPANEISGLMGLHLDLDIAGPAHKKKALPKTIKDGLALLPKDLPPTMIVHTGHGAHIYWLFDKPWIFMDKEERQRAAKLLHEWQRIILSYARACGYLLDSTSDISRVMRMPGTLNLKDPSNPILATLVEADGPRYTVVQLQAYVDHVAMPPEIAPRSADAPIAPVKIDIESSSALPPPVLAELLNDGKFAAIWHHRREDLASQSEVDLAIANYLIEGGFPDQTIADAIVHNRRDRNANEPKGRRPDYIARTITKAKQKIRAMRPAVEIPTKLPSDPALVRAIYLECLSALVGQPVVDVTKLVGDEPLWTFYLCVDGEEKRVTFHKPCQLTNFELFRERFVACCEGITPVPMKQAQWTQAFPILDKVIRAIQGGDESSEAARCIALLDAYLIERNLEESIEILLATGTRNLGRPFVADDQIAISSLDLSEFAKLHGEALGHREIGAMLHSIGAQTRKFAMPGRTSQRRWLLPERDWDWMRYRREANEERKEGNVPWVKTQVN